MTEFDEPLPLLRQALAEAEDFIRTNLDVAPDGETPPVRLADYVSDPAAKETLEDFMALDTWTGGDTTPVIADLSTDDGRWDATSQGHVDPRVFWDALIDLYGWYGDDAEYPADHPPVHAYAVVSGETVWWQSEPEGADFAVTVWSNENLHETFIPARATPAGPLADSVVDLMAALEQSVADAKAAAARRRRPV